jgi:DNA-binding CsgD family transcriptional regulator
VLRVLRAGATGFLVWSIRPEDLIGLVQVAAEGHTVLSPAAAAADRGLRRSAPGPRDRARHLAASLTGREAQVPACLGEGLSNAQIAARLYLSEATVKGYVSQVLDKLGCATAPRPACSPTTPRYRQLVARVGEAAGCSSGWVRGRPGCVLRPDVRAGRVRRAARARRESAAVAILSLTRSVASCCRISGCMGPPGLGGRPRAAGQVTAGRRGRVWSGRGAGRRGG